MTSLTKVYRLSEQGRCEWRCSSQGVTAVTLAPGSMRRVDGREETMTNHATGTREEWLAARIELLAAEKELTRRGDELARRRRELPWVRVEKD